MAVPAPGRGPGCWAGAPSAALDRDGAIVLAYRVRDPERRGGAVVIARAVDHERFATELVLDKDRFGAESLERPALVRTADGGWRLYVCCATPHSAHWRIDALDARVLPALAEARPTTVFAGDERTGVKDPVIRRRAGRWEAWICCHPLDEPGHEDRMTTAYVTSADGLTWGRLRTVLAPRPSGWDARGTRVTAVLADGRALYDGRATREENFSERTGVAVPVAGGGLRAAGDRPVAVVRYVDAVAGTRRPPPVLRGAAAGRQPRAAYGADQPKRLEPPPRDRCSDGSDEQGEDGGIEHGRWFQRDRAAVLRPPDRDWTHNRCATMWRDADPRCDCRGLALAIWPLHARHRGGGRDVLVGPRHRRGGGARLLAARPAGACLRRRRRPRDGRRTGRARAPPGRPGGAHRERGPHGRPGALRSRGRAGAGRARHRPGPRGRLSRDRLQRGGRVQRARRRPVALTGLEVVGTVPDGFHHPVHGYVGLHVMHLRL